MINDDVASGFLCQIDAVYVLQHSGLHDVKAIDGKEI